MRDKFSRVKSANKLRIWFHINVSYFGWAIKKKVPPPSIIVLPNKMSQGRARSSSVAGAVTQLPPSSWRGRGICNGARGVCATQSSRQTHKQHQLSRNLEGSNRNNNNFGAIWHWDWLDLAGPVLRVLAAPKAKQLCYCEQVMPLNLNRPRSRPGVNETCAYVHSPQQWVIMTTTTWMRSVCERELIKREI